MCSGSFQGKLGRTLDELVKEKIYSRLGFPNP